MVAHAPAIKEAIAEGRRPPPPAQDYGPSWEAATRAQMALAAQGHDGAEAAVQSMVNHLTHLAEETAWFPADATLAEAAISETIERVAYAGTSRAGSLRTHESAGGRSARPVHPVGTGPAPGPEPDCRTPRRPSVRHGPGRCRTIRHLA